MLHHPQVNLSMAGSAIFPLIRCTGICPFMSVEAFIMSSDDYE